MGQPPLRLFLTLKINSKFKKLNFPPVLCLEILFLHYFMSTRYVSTWPDRFLPRFIKFFEVRIQPRGDLVFLFDSYRNIHSNIEYSDMKKLFCVRLFFVIVGCYRTQHFSVVVVHTRTLPFFPHPHCNRTRTVQMSTNLQKILKN